MIESEISHRERQKVEREKRIEWLASLKEGDEVYATMGGMYSRGGGAICAIDKITSTQIVIGTIRYNRMTGSERGNYGNIIPATDEIREQVAAKVTKARKVRAVK